MIRLGWKNLVQDKVRLAVTLTGVLFAVALMLLQSGIYFGFTSNVSSRVDHCPADVWLVSKGALNADTVRPFPEEDLLRVKGVPGIAWAENLTRSFAFLRLPDGAGTWALVYGCNPDTGIGGPWEMIRGAVRDLRKPGTYIVDESTLPLLRGATLGDKLENFNHKIEIAGVCRGAKSTNTYPVLFTSVRTAQAQSFQMEDQANFIAARFAPDADPLRVMERLKSLRYYDVYTKEEFSATDRDYWATKTGVGVGVGLTMILAFIVGLVIVGQTMYTATVERIREYATLKALGATNLDVCRAIWTQAAVVTVVGYALGTIATLSVTRFFATSVLTVELTPALFAGIFVATLVMCFGASLLSIARVLRVDPATVFRT